MQPWAQRRRLTNRPSLPRQHEKHRLRCVLSRIDVAKHVETDAVNYRTMPPDQFGKSGFSGLVFPGQNPLRSCSSDSSIPGLLFRRERTISGTAVASRVIGWSPGYGSVLHHSGSRGA
jgi:hypothetical protein